MEALKNIFESIALIAGAVLVFDAIIVALIYRGSNKTEKNLSNNNSEGAMK